MEFIVIMVLAGFVVFGMIHTAVTIVKESMEVCLKLETGDKIKFTPLKRDNIILTGNFDISGKVGRGENIESIKLKGGPNLSVGMELSEVAPGIKGKIMFIDIHTEGVYLTVDKRK